MFLMWGALLLLLVITSLAQKVIDCEGDKVTVKWRPVLKLDLNVDPSKAHLGTCPPSTLADDPDVLQFFVSLRDCGFRKWVGSLTTCAAVQCTPNQLGVDQRAFNDVAICYDIPFGSATPFPTITTVNREKVIYTNLLTYELGDERPPIVELVQCSYDISGMMTNLDGMRTNFVFHMNLMNSDFSGPATSTIFPLGSRISVGAKVEQEQELTPVQIYLQSCVLAKTSDLTGANQLHTLISNAGCLSESKEGNSTYLPRLIPSEIHFYFQAFKFALEEPVFLHCDVAAWDHQSFSVDRKACHYLHDQKRWQLLDDPDQSYLCSCCDATCQGNGFKRGISTHKVLGPFTVVDSENGESNKHAVGRADQGLGGFPVWVIVLAVFLLLILMTGAVSVGYYMCFWRGGRLGYRPSRDLLSKY